MAHCPQCGSELPESARFCGTCGYTVAQAPPAQAPPAQAPKHAVAAQTMLGVPSPIAIPPAPAPQPAPEAPKAPPPHARTMLGIPQALPVPAPAPAPAPAQAKTMVGLPASALPIAPAPAAPQAAAPQAVAPPGNQGGRHGQTMLGVAAPGIAPVQSAPTRQPSVGKTMLGVAVPGIAPVRAQPVPALAPAELPPIVPPPPPLVDEPLPEPPPAPVKRGIPIVMVAAIAGAIVLVGGAAIGIALLRGGTPIVASPKVGPEGQDQLHVRCDGCADGAIVHAGSTQATFKDHEADLDLPSPLAVGDNAIDLALERAPGRSESVKLVVPVAYRVQPDLDAITKVPPAIVIRVQAKAGSKVTVDGAPVTLDAQNSASLSVPIDDAVGPADDMRTFERAVAYEVDHDGKSDKGTVKTRVPITPLRVDAPTPSVITDASSLTIAGRAAKGSTVTVDGKEITVRPDGYFDAQIDVTGDKEITTAAFVAKTASGAPLGARLVRVKVRKVASLEEEAKRQDKEYGLGYDALTQNLQSNVGQPFVLSGPVLDARRANHLTLLIVDDERGCANKNKCIARVVYGGEAQIAAGDYVRAYGKLSGTVAWNGSNVPDVEAAFVLKGRK